MIKFSKITFFALLTLFMTACGGDDDMATVEGQWQATEVRTDDGRSTTTTSDGQTFVFDYTMVGEDLDLMVNFNSDNTFTSSGNYTGILKGNANGQPIEQSATINDFAAMGTWSIEGDQMTTVSPENDNVPQTATLLTLTDNMMEIEYQINRTETQNGVLLNYEGTVFYRLEK